MSHSQDYEVADQDYGFHGFREASRTKTSDRRRPTHSRRRGKAPQSVNGIHRRRRRKMTW